MNTNAYLKFRPGSLFITTFVASYLLIMPATAAAEDSLLRLNTLSDMPLVKTLVDGELKLANVGHRAGLHMSLESATRDTGASYSSPAADNLEGESGLHLSYRLSW